MFVALFRSFIDLGFLNGGFNHGFGLATFAAVTFAALVFVAGRFRFAAQGFQLIPGFEQIALVFADHWPFRAFEAFRTFRLAVTFRAFGLGFRVELDQDDISHRIRIEHLALAIRRHHAFAAFRQFLAGCHILLVFINQAAAQAAAHPGDFGGGQ